MEEIIEMKISKIVEYSEWLVTQDIFEYHKDNLWQGIKDNKMHSTEEVLTFYMNLL